MKKIITTLLISASFFLGSCLGVKGNPKPENTGFASYKVEFAGDFDPGTSENRLEAQGTFELAINVTALDYDGEIVSDYNEIGEVELQFGKLNSVKRIEFKNGISENFAVEMKYSVDKERIVVHELVVDEENSTETSTVYKRTGKLGVSPEIFIEPATISEIQSNNSGSKGFDSKYNGRNITLKGKEMVVIAVLEGGFYLKEVGVDDYSSIYLYTYSTPYVDDPSVGYTLPVGSVIEEANGSVYEFFGFTEMSFPTFKPKYVEKNGKTTILVDKSLVPEPYDVTDILSSSDEMEKKEALIVSVKNVHVEWFNENDDSFVEYGQFPVTTESGANIMVTTLYTAPSFNPVGERDRETKKRFNFTGVLKQHTSARPSNWILVPRDSNDIEEVE